LSLCIKLRYNAKNNRLNAKKFAIFRTRLFINTGFTVFKNIGFSSVLRPQDNDTDYFMQDHKPCNFINRAIIRNGYS
jgi:hypothetical protein